MTECNPEIIHQLFEDGGELLRAEAGRSPTKSVVTLAMDDKFTQVREDSFQVSRLRGETLEVQGVFVDGIQLWNQPELLEAAVANVTSLYDPDPGPSRLLRPLVDRDFAVRNSLRHDRQVTGLRGRARIGYAGELYDFDADTVLVTVNPINHNRCGKLISQRRHGGVVLDAANSAMMRFGFDNDRLLYRREGESSATANYRISTVAQNVFMNLIFSQFAEEAHRNGRPWIYKTTQNPEKPSSSEPVNAYYTVDPLPHKHVEGLYCKISPAFRELVALLTQSLARFYMAGGSPDSVNQDILRKLVSRVNEGYDEESATVQELLQTGDRVMDKIAV